MNKELKTYIKIKGWGEMNLDILVDTVKMLKGKGIWKLKNWRPTPALIDKTSKSSIQYVGQNYNQNYFELVPYGWTHDHCEFCTKRISNNENYDDCFTQGYNLDNDWICEKCYNLFMAIEDIENELEKYRKVTK